jgi:hypothetical protein
MQKPMIIAGIAIAAAGAVASPHGHVAPDCHVSAEFCTPPEVLYLPDEPAPEQARPQIAEPPVAASSGSAVHRLVASDLTIGPPNLGMPDFGGGAALLVETV